MAADETLDPEAETNPGTGGGMFFPLIMLVTAAVAGAAVPFLLPLVEGLNANDQSEVSSQAGSLVDGATTYVSFGEVTVNLDEGRMNRYLRLKISLQVPKAEKEMIEKMLEQQNLVLRNWLLSHLSDKTLDEIRGKVGQNKLRREIRDYFNTSLFPRSYDHIQDILFEEFNVQ